MFTDSSAEASALGSGPRGRRFKSALSENQKTTTFPWKVLTISGNTAENKWSDSKKHSIFVNFLWKNIVIPFFLSINSCI